MGVKTLYKITVCIEPRDDGGLRVWCDDLPELVLSHSNADQVIADIPRAMEVILSARLRANVSVAELTDLPAFNEAREQIADRPKAGPVQREFAAQAA